MSGRASEHPNRVRVRPFRADDREFVLELAPRLVIGCAPWRDPEKMRAAMRGFLEEDAERAGERSAVFVAEDEHGELLGAVTVGHHVNFTGEVEAYIGELAVRADREGAGVGQALVRAAEKWARAHGYGLLVLETGAANTRARAFYARLGYREESVKLARVLT
jgi:ribosomal protein S18 acetylase RimI-like enzyme